MALPAAAPESPLSGPDGFPIVGIGTKLSYFIPGLEVNIHSLREGIVTAIEKDRPLLGENFIIHLRSKTAQRTSWWISTYIHADQHVTIPKFHSFFFKQLTYVVGGTPPVRHSLASDLRRKIEAIPFPVVPVSSPGTPAPTVVERVADEDVGTTVDETTGGPSDGLGVGDTLDALGGPSDALGGGLGVGDTLDVEDIGDTRARSVNFTETGTEPDAPSRPHYKILHLQDPQQPASSLGCGPSIVMHMFMEVLSAFVICDRSVLDGRDSYRRNIKAALHTRDVFMLNPGHTPDVNASHNNFIGSGLAHVQDWESIAPGMPLSDAVVFACSRLIQDKHDDFLAAQRVHGGSVCIVDSLFTGKIVSGDDGTAEKFITHRMQTATKLILPINASGHWIMFSLSPQSIHDFVFRLHDSSSNHVMEPSREIIALRVANFLSQHEIGFTHGDHVEQFQHQRFPLHVKAVSADFIVDRLNLTTGALSDLLTPVCAPPAMSVDSTDLLSRLSVASNPARMPQLDPGPVRNAAVLHMVYNPPVNVGALIPSFHDFLTRTSTDREYAGEAVIRALAARNDCPVVVLVVEDGELQILSVHGRDTGGAPIFLLLFHPGTLAAHYVLCIPSNLPHYTRELDAAVRLVHIAPATAQLRVGLELFDLAVFGVPTDGNCLFMSFDLAFKSRLPSWQEGGERYKREVRRYCSGQDLTVGETTAVAVVKRLWQHEPSIRAVRNITVSSSDNSHAFDETMILTVMKLNKVRDLNGVGMGRPHSVFMDPGAGTQCILLAESHFHPDKVCIGFELEPDIHERGKRIHLAANDTVVWKGRFATRCADAVHVGPFDGVTNVGMFDGVCSRVDSLDLGHARLIGKLMATPSIDEITTTKLGSIALLLKYREHDADVRNYEKEFDIFVLTNCPRQHNKLNCWMFIRKPAYRADRSAPPPASCSPPVATTVSDMIANVRTQWQLPSPFISNDMHSGASMNSDMVALSWLDGVAPSTRCDLDGEKHGLLLGGVTTHCYRTGSRYDYGQRVLHKSTNTQATVVGVSINVSPQDSPLFCSLLLQVATVRPATRAPHRARVASTLEHAFWLVSLADIACEYPKSAECPDVESIKARVDAPDATLMCMGVGRSGVRRSKRVRNLDEDVKACEPVSKKSSPTALPTTVPAAHKPSHMLRTPSPLAAQSEDALFEDRPRRSVRGAEKAAEKELKDEEAELGKLQARLLVAQAASAKKKALYSTLMSEIKRQDSELANSRKTSRRRGQTIADRSEKDEEAGGLSTSIDKMGGDLKLMGADMLSQSKHVNTLLDRLDKTTGTVVKGVTGAVVKGVTDRISKLLVDKAGPGPDLKVVHTHLDNFSEALKASVDNVDQMIVELRGRGTPASSVSGAGPAADSGALVGQVVSAISGKLDALVASGHLNSTATATTALGEQLRTQVSELRTEALEHNSQQLRTHAAELRTQASAQNSEQLQTHAMALRSQGEKHYSLVQNLLNEQFREHSVKVSQDTNVVKGLSAITRQMSHKLDLQERDLSAQRLEDIKAAVQKGSHDAAAAAATQNASMELKWSKFSTELAHQGHANSLQRFETIVGQTNKSLQDHAYARGVTQALSDQRHCDNRGPSQPNRRPPHYDQEFDQDRGYFDSVRDARRSKRARLGRGPVDQLHEDASQLGASSSVQEPLSMESDAKAKIDWECWTPADMLAWMEKMGAQAIGDILFPTDVHGRAPFDLKHGSQLGLITTAVLEKIGDPEDVRLNFAKTTFAQQLAKLLKDHPPAPS